MLRWHAADTMICISFRALTRGCCLCFALLFVCCVRVCFVLVLYVHIVHVLQEMDFNDSARQMAGRMSDFVPVPPIGATDLFIATPFPRPNSPLRHLFRDRIATPFLSTSVFSIRFRYTFLV